MNNSVDWSKLRADFPILQQSVHGKPLVYFDNAATSQKPRRVIDALVQYYERDNANVHRGIHELSNRATSAFEAARTRAAAFINARSADEIIFTRGTTEGVNLVAATWGAKHLKAGDVILLTELEHHSNLVPWQMLAQRTGAKIAYVPVTGDECVITAETVTLLSGATVPVRLFYSGTAWVDQANFNARAVMHMRGEFASGTSSAGSSKVLARPFPRPSSRASRTCWWRTC